ESCAINLGLTRPGRRTRRYKSVPSSGGSNATSRPQMNGTQAHQSVVRRPAPCAFGKQQVDVRRVLTPMAFARHAKEGCPLPRAMHDGAHLSAQNRTVRGSDPTMKLVRYGAPGREKPGIIGDDGKIRDLSRVVKDIDGAMLASGGLAKIKKANLKRMKPVS